MKDIYPYCGVEFDRRVILSNGSAYRFITYTRIEGREDASPAAAVFDDTRKVVLIDGLYAGDNAKSLEEHLQALIEGGLPKLVSELNAHPAARHKLNPDGSIPW